jgi:hypothetical protein
MSLLTKSVPITTAADGSDLTTVRLGACILRLIRLELGTLSTPDILITEQPGNKTLLSVAAVAADKDYTPTMLGQTTGGVDVVGAALPMPVLDRIQIAIAGGGSVLTGRLIFFYEH